MTSLISPSSSPANLEPPGARSCLSKARAPVSGPLPRHRRSLSLHPNLIHYHFPHPYPARDPAAARPRPSIMLARINTNMHSPDRPTRRPHGPRSACSPKSAASVTSAKSAKRTHFADIWKAKAGPSTIRTSPPQMSLPHDADVEQDPLFNVASEQFVTHKPRRYCLKLLDIDATSSSDEESPFDSLFSFTASPVDSPSYATTTFSSRQPSRPARPASPKSFLSPITPTIVVQRYGNGDSVDRWLSGGGMEPLHTPMVVDHKSPEFWHDTVAQADWRELIDQFLQQADFDDALFPPTPGPGATFAR